MNQTKGRPISVVILFAVLILGFVLIGGVHSLVFPSAAEEIAAPDDDLYAIFPDTADFVLLYDASAANESSLQGVSPTVCTITAETSGFGYIVTCTTTEGFSGEPMDLTVVIDSEGRIAFARVDTYPDTNDFGQDEYPLTFVGQDSSLSDVELVAGCTFSSSAYKDAVADAFSALISNGLVEPGKDDSSIQEGSNHGNE